MAMAFQAIVGAMVSGLVATETPPDRRSATLNLIYLPLYVGGIAGPAIGAVAVTAGVSMVFFVAAAFVAVATVLAVIFARRTGKRPDATPATPAVD
jgi:MFS family permease